MKTRLNRYDYENMTLNDISMKDHTGMVLQNSQKTTDWDRNKSVDMMY